MTSKLIPNTYSKTDFHYSKPSLAQQVTIKFMIYPENNNAVLSSAVGNVDYSNYTQIIQLM